MMKVINILSDGTQVEDISKIEVPTDNNIYNVCQGIENVRDCRQNTDQEKQTEEKLRNNQWL